MKRDWTTVALGEVARVVSGATPKTGVEEYWDGEIPWATPKDLSGLQGAEIHATSRMITGSGLRSCAASVLPVGSVLLSSRAPIGYAAINSVPMTTNQGFKSLVPKAGVLDAKYLYHWLKGNREQLESLGNGATFKEISKAVVSRVEIPLPPIEEQRRIAAILDRTTDLCAAADVPVSRLGEVKSATFREMFGDLEAFMLDTTCPVFGDHVADLQGGRNLVGADATAETPYRVLKISAVTSGTFRPEESKPLPQDYVPAQTHLVRAGDLLMSRANTTALVGATALVHAAPANLALPDKLWRLVWRDPAQVDVSYMATLFQTPAIRRALSARSSGTGGSMKNIAKAKIMQMPLPVASPEQQVDFARRAREIDASVALAEDRRCQLEVLLKALQARAFSGRL